MIKLVYCVRRHPDLSAEEFHRYWLERHGPLVRSVAEAIGARRYVQSHTTQPRVNEALATSRGSAEPYDGIAEVWFDGPDEMMAASAAQQGLDAGKQLLEDEARFIDLAHSRLFMTEEHEIFDLRQD